MGNINQEILNKLNQLQIDIEFIKENIEEDGELTEWAEKELDEARKRPNSEKISHEEVKRRILAK